MIQSNWFPMPTGNFVCRELARALIHTARPSYDTGDTVSLRLSAGSRLLNHVAADRLKPHLPHANENLYSRIVPLLEVIRVEIKSLITLDKRF